MKNHNDAFESEVEAPCLENRRFTVILMILPLLVVMLIALIVYVRNLFATARPVAEKVEKNALSQPSLVQNGDLNVCAESS